MRLAVEISQMPQDVLIKSDKQNSEGQVKNEAYVRCSSRRSRPTSDQVTTGRSRLVQECNTRGVSRTVTS